MMAVASALLLGAVPAVASHVKAKQLRNAVASMPYKVCAPMKAAGANEVITEAPEGKVLKMTRSGMAYYTFFGDPTWGDYYGMCGEIVECENGDVYVKDPISMAPSYSYIKGERVGDKVYFDLPQSILSLHNEDGSLMYFYTSLFQYYDRYNWFFRANSSEAEKLGLPEINNQMVLDVNEDGSYSYYGENNGDVILGLYSDMSAESDEGSWLCFGEAVSVWKVFDEEYVSAPEGIDYKSMAMNYADGAYFVSVGFDGNDVYFKGLFKELPQSIVKGTLEGDRIVINPGQYLGISFLESGLSYYTYLMTAKAEREWNERYELWETELEKTGSFAFIYDEETESLTTETDMTALVMNCGDVIIDDVAYLINPSMKKQAEGLSKVPANPYSVEYYNTYGLPYLSFDLPVININGDVLDINNLYYKIFVDGEEFTFYSDEYIGIDGEEMTMVPYSFQNAANDFMVNGYNHIVYFDLVDVDTYGVQLLYVEEGEVVGESNIVTIATEMTDATTPADPYDVGFDEKMIQWGIYTLKFRLPDYNLNGEKLDLNNLYYKVFVAGNEYTFYPKDYPVFMESTTLIPYKFTDEMDYLIIATGSLHTVDFENLDARSYGVQLFYIVDDVIYGKSNIVTIPGLNSTGVGEVAEDAAKEIVSEKYYSVSGAEVSRNYQGIMIKVVTYGDGSSKSVKIVGK